MNTLDPLSYQDGLQRIGGLGVGRFDDGKDGGGVGESPDLESGKPELQENQAACACDGTLAASEETPPFVVKLIQWCILGSCFLVTIAGKAVGRNVVSCLITEMHYSNDEAVLLNNLWEAGTSWASVGGALVHMHVSHRRFVVSIISATFTLAAVLLAIGGNVSTLVPHCVHANSTIEIADDSECASANPSQTVLLYITLFLFGIAYGALQWYFFALGVEIIDERKDADGNSEKHDEEKDSRSTLKLDAGLDEKQEMTDVDRKDSKSTSQLNSKTQNEEQDLRLDSNNLNETQSKSTLRHRNNKHEDGVQGLILDPDKLDEKEQRANDVEDTGSSRLDELKDDEGQDSKVESFSTKWTVVTFAGWLVATPIVMIEDSGHWGWGTSLVAVAAVAALIPFCIGMLYIKYRARRETDISTNKLFQRTFRVLFACARNWRMKVSESAKLYEAENDQLDIQNQGRKIAHTERFKWLDKAATIPAEDLSDGNSRKLCTVTEVEEVKNLICILPLLLGLVINSLIHVQMFNTLWLQGYNMDNSIAGKLTIAPALLSSFGDVPKVLCNLCKRLLPCHIRRRLSQIPHWQRVCCALGLSTLAMAVAAVVEIVRLRVAKHHDLLDNTEEKVPMSIFWQVPVYFLLGVSDVFTDRGFPSMICTQAPYYTTWKVEQTLEFVSDAVACIFNIFLVIVVNFFSAQGGEHSKWIPDNLNRGHLDHFFELLATASLLPLAIVMFLRRAKKATKVVESEEDDVQESAADRAIEIMSVVEKNCDTDDVENSTIVQLEDAVEEIAPDAAEDIAPDLKSKIISYVKNIYERVSGRINKLWRLAVD